MRDGYFTATSSGNGSFSDITVNGAMANQNSKNTTESFNGVTYSIANTNGSGTITFPTASTPLTTLISGQKTFYVSADGAPIDFRECTISLSLHSASTAMAG